MVYAFWPIEYVNIYMAAFMTFEFVYPLVALAGISVLMTYFKYEWYYLFDFMNEYHY